MKRLRWFFREGLARVRFEKKSSQRIAIKRFVVLIYKKSSIKKLNPILKIIYQKNLTTFSNSLIKKSNHFQIHLSKKNLTTFKTLKFKFKKTQTKIKKQRKNTPDAHRGRHETLKPPSRLAFRGSQSVARIAKIHQKTAIFPFLIRWLPMAQRRTGIAKETSSISLLLYNA